MDGVKPEQVTQEMLELEASLLYAPEGAVSRPRNISTLQVLHSLP